MLLIYGQVWYYSTVRSTSPLKNLHISVGIYADVPIHGVQIF